MDSRKRCGGEEVSRAKRHKAPPTSLSVVLDRLLRDFRAAVQEPLQRWREAPDQALRKSIVRDVILPLVRAASQKSREAFQRGTPTLAVTVCGPH
jgi:hypothetical protein